MQLVHAPAFSESQDAIVRLEAEHQTWKFSGEDSPEFSLSHYNDSRWSRVGSHPHNWKDPVHTPHSKSSLGWYRIGFTAPVCFSRKSLILRLGPLHDADETYLNGELIGSTGIISPENGRPLEHGYDRIRLYRIPSHLLNLSGNNILAIRIQALFPGEAGFRDVDSVIEIGTESVILNGFFLEQLAAFFFITILFIFSLHSLFLFLRDLQSTENLFLGIALLLISVFYLVDTQIKYFVIFDYIFLKRIEYLSLVFVPSLILSFTQGYFPRRQGGFMRHIPRIILMSYVIPFIGAFLYIISDDPVFWDRVYSCFSEPLYLPPFLLCLFLMINEALRKNIHAVIMLTGFIITGLLCLHDILVARALLSSVRIGAPAFIVFLVTFRGGEIFLRNRFSGRGKNIRPESGGRITDETEAKLNSAIAFIKENYLSSISREGLAAHFDLSPDYMGRLFKVHTGKRINEYINALRVNRARELLTGFPDMQIADIAVNTGFDNQRSFNRTFIRETGQTPSEYRRKSSVQI